MAVDAHEELAALAGRWGLDLSGDGLVATGTVPEAGEPRDGSDDPAGWGPPRDEEELSRELCVRAGGKGTFVTATEPAGGGLVSVRIELVPDGERGLPEGWALELGGVGHCGPGGWVFHYLADRYDDGPGLAVVTSGTDGTDAERERVADRAGAERVFARHGNHW